MKFLKCTICSQRIYNILRPVMVGKLVNLVIRLQQSRNRDTMVSSCMVQGSRGPEEEEKQRRRSERGFYQQVFGNKNFLYQREGEILLGILSAYLVLWKSIKSQSVKFLVVTKNLFHRITRYTKFTFCQTGCPYRNEKNSLWFFLNFGIFKFFQFRKTLTAPSIKKLKSWNFAQV